MALYSRAPRCALRPNQKFVCYFAFYLGILRENSLVPRRIRLQLYQEQRAGRKSDRNGTESGA